MLDDPVTAETLLAQLAVEARARVNRALNDTLRREYELRAYALEAVLELGHRAI